LTRTNFAFMHLRWFRPEELASVRKGVRSVQREGVGAPITATDIDPCAVESARANAQTAGVERFIEFGVCDFADTPLPPAHGVIVMNPEYGKRMGDVAGLSDIYRRIGGFFKHACAGWRGYVFTGNLDLPKYIGLKARRRLPFRSGDLECRLYEYELYEGSKSQIPSAKFQTRLNTPKKSQ
jgi:putative N6-adenine-specific DNA methylase